MKTPPDPPSRDVLMAREKLASLYPRVVQGDITNKELTAALLAVCHYLKVPT